MQLLSHPSIENYSSKIMSIYSISVLSVLFWSHFSGILVYLLQPVVSYVPAKTKAFVQYRPHHLYHKKQKTIYGRTSHRIISKCERRSCALLRLSAEKHDNDEAGALFVGFDLGTSGARVSVIKSTSQPTTSAEFDAKWKEVYADSISWGDEDYDNPSRWMDAIYSLLRDMKVSSNMKMSSIRAICFSGTSSSCVLARRTRNTTFKENVNQRPADVLENRKTRSNGRARMYNYNVVSDKVMTTIEQIAPQRHTVCSPTSSLAKLLLWNLEEPIKPDEIFCHQADYVAAQFISSFSGSVPVASDWHNCLKLGYDIRELQYPKWLLDCLQRECNITEPEKTFLPNPVVSPGEPIGRIRIEAAEFLGLSPTTMIVAGTTDSNAAFIAATDGMANPGIAVTSLGSTLAIKQVSATYVEDSRRGVYSHRFPSTLSQNEPARTNDNNSTTEIWLVGGASNVGCAVLRKFKFSNNELEELSKKIDPSIDSSLSYYPLVKTGERFPISDPSKEPILEPIPSSRVEFLHGILQGITNVERDGFIVLGQLGSYPTSPNLVLTCGGGAQNPTWIQLRQRVLQQSFSANLHVRCATNVEASYGAAILAASIG